MIKDSIDITYEKIFETYDTIEIKEHIKKLIELDFYYPYNATFFCITNTSSQTFEYVSKNFHACTGLDSEELLKGGMNYFWSRFHESDIKLWLTGLQRLMEFTMKELTQEQRSKMNYTWNYRLKKADGNYVNIIQNTTPLQFDESQKPVVGLAHYTVLESHVKMDICASAQYLNEKKEYETLFFTNITNENLLGCISHRERDIVRLLLKNQTSKEISEKLFISKHTVDTHRRNILKKYNLRSTNELINFFKNNANLL